MALLLLEGFDHMTAAQLIVKGWSGAGSSVQTGRFGQSAMRFAASGAILTVTKPIAPGSTTVVVGAAVRNNGMTAGSTQDFIQLRVGATAVLRVFFSMTAGGIVTVSIRNSAGTIIGVGTTTITIGTWRYYEVKGFFNGASGTCELHIDGNPVAEIASTVGNFGSTTPDNLLILGQFSGGYDWDDIYVLDSTGPAPRNNFLGDCRIITIFPTSDGASSQWTPSTGSAHWSLVDDATPNDDTDFVSDSTVNDIDLYGCGDVDTSALVFGVQHNLYARKDDATLRQIAPVVRQSGSNTVGTTFTLGSSYAFFSQIYNQDPTAADWTPTTVNANEYGVKEIA